MNKERKNYLLGYYSYTIFMLIGLFLLSFSSFQVGILKERYPENYNTPFDKLSNKFDNHYTIVEPPLEYLNQYDLEYSEQKTKFYNYLSKMSGGAFLIGLIGIGLFDLSARYSYYYLWMFNNKKHFGQRLKEFITKIKKGEYK